jgi:hypothetical protein
LRTRPQNISILIAVIALAAALTLAASGGALARSTFQSSIVPPPAITRTVPPIPTFTPTPIFTPSPTFTPGGGDIITQTPFIPEMTPTATPVTEATPIVPVVSDATPTTSGFLPPPTLVNPSSAAPGRLSPMATGNQPLVGAAELPAATSTSIPIEAPSAAQLIDSGVVALSYLWLCCGALLLAAAALTIVWLSRRSKRR